MARSIHTTRRNVRDHARDDHGDRDQARAEGQRLRAELATKRRIKAQVAAERAREPLDGAVVDPATIPIVVEDVGEHVHHAASPEDILAILRRLPPGVADGLTSITLLPSRALEDGGRVLGCYFPDRACIELYADDLEPEQPFRPFQALHLKLRALATLAHEVAHHHDHTARVARGRWRADHDDQQEIYAERMEHAWFEEVVIPYLEQAYAAELARLRAWMIEHGGAALPLALLAGDPRVTRKGGRRVFRWGVSGALETLFADVAAGADPVETRIAFATELHYADEYAIPRAILAGVLAEHPTHHPALTLLADIDVHEGLHRAAEALSREVLARDPDDLEAWIVLVDALCGQTRWADVVAAATRAIACACAADSLTDAARLLRDRARAHLELGDHAGVERDLCALALGGRIDRKRAADLRRAQLDRLRA